MTVFLGEKAGQDEKKPASQPSNQPAHAQCLAAAARQRTGLSAQLTWWACLQCDFIGEGDLVVGEEKFCFVLRSGLNSRLILDGLLGVRGIGCVLMNEEQEGATGTAGCTGKTEQKKRQARHEAKQRTRRGLILDALHVLGVRVRSAPC